MRRSVRSLVVLCGAGLAVINALAPAAAGGGVNDPVFAQGLQWGLERIGAPGAWARGTGEGISIAVIDSGVDLTHEDLAPQLDAHISCIGTDGVASACQGSGQDDNGHGSHVAGIALAATNNRAGVAGVAPDARLLAVRVLENTCDGDTCTATGAAEDVAAGIRWAADHGADVINLSLGGGALQGALGCSFCDAVEYAWSKGAIPVIAAGNDSVLPAGFSDEHAVVVTATTRADTRASYSNASSGLLRAARWPVAAPGGEGETDPNDCATGGTPKGILSSYWVEGGTADDYACLAGTSMAAPHVAGSLAVLRSTGLAPQAAIDRLLVTAQDLGAPGRDDEFGVGRIDLGRAVGTAPGGTSTTSSIPGTTSTTTTLPPPSTTAPSTTTPGETTTTAPPVSTPEIAAPAPYAADGAATDEEAPTWLVILAIMAVLISGGATTVVLVSRHVPTRP